MSHPNRGRPTLRPPKAGRVGTTDAPAREHREQRGTFDICHFQARAHVMQDIDSQDPRTK